MINLDEDKFKTINHLPEKFNKRYEELFYAVEFSDLFSGHGEWIVQLLDADLNTIHGEQRCLPGEISKFIIFNGKKISNGIHYLNSFYNLQRLQVESERKIINLYVTTNSKQKNTAQYLYKHTHKKFLLRN